jgi:rhodanese-related sulfurtransferase
MIDTISPSTLYERLKKEEICLIDVREKDEYDVAHINPCTLIPLSSFNISQLPQSEKPYVIYCRSGKRSSYITGLIKNLNSSLTVYNLEGGILDWIKLGLPVDP